MQPSMEVRWFLRGEMPKDIEDWFRKGTVLGSAVSFAEEKRDDIYLALAETTNLSIKARAAETICADQRLRPGSKLEIKQRQQDIGIHQLWDNVAGRLEKWVKWSFNTPPHDEAGNAISQPDIALPQGCWIAVQKPRLVRKFAVNERTVQAVNREERPAEGCLMEITWAEALGHPWWSLSFEAFGSLDTVQSNLELVLNYVQHDPKFPQMQKADSFAYPEWIGRLLKN